MARVTRDVAIIGAGAAGLGCSARMAQLRNQGLWEGKVRMYESSRDIGGKCAVHTTDKHYFDHGFQRMKAPETKAWKTVFTSLRQQRMTSAWVSKEVEHDHATKTSRVVPEEERGRSFVFSPSSKVLHKAVWLNFQGTETDTVRVDSTIVKVQRWERDQWVFQAEQQHKWGRADTLVLACPPQAILPAFCGSEEFPLPDSPVIEQCAKVGHYPLVSFLIGWHIPHLVNFDVLNVANHPVIARIYNQNTKLERPDDVTSLCVVSTPEFAVRAMHMGADRTVAEMGAALQDLDEFKSLETPPTFAASHLWTHAVHNNDTPFAQFWDEAAGIGVCGDWTMGKNTLEAAWTSGVRLANKMAGVEDLDEFEDITNRNMRTMGVYSKKPNKQAPFFNFQKAIIEGEKNTR
eukprot:TRINITY_DN9062_c0_g1_i1.p3 TRINITY_DN9062_c0_g1~~TRINITY_DN9062_c0_g1_i1.p3  ORF type:complete len:404 (+),score=141.87 TRINITY_DN9062_c0_g1_i1:64-1275(+)